MFIEGYREKAIRVSRLRKVLEALPARAMIGPLVTGNFSVLIKDKGGEYSQIGWIDLMDDRYVPLDALETP